MEILVAVVSSLMVEPCRIVFASLQSKIQNFFYFESALIDLDKEMKALVERKLAVNQELEEAQRVGQVPRAQVKDWLRRVNMIEAEVNTMTAEIEGRTSNGIQGCYFNCRNREKIRVAALEKLVGVKRLIEASSFPAGVAVTNQFPVIVEHIPGPSIEDQSTAGRNIAKVMDLLNDDKVQRIGIWGMGGVGKTTLVKNVNNKLKNDPLLTKPFSIVIWITVSNKSEESDLRRVQSQIADRLKMACEGDMERLAIQLYDRLEKEKFLLILDDVWDPIDLDVVGVPQPEMHTGSKVLVTTRFSEVCGAMMTDLILKVEVLNEEEAWQLFCKCAGEVAISEHVEPLAKAVTRECCGLPLAIIVVGASMRGKKMVELWEDALNILRRSQPIIRGIEDKVYNPLKWSYDSLPDKHIKFCFLFCCLYPEDYSISVDELVRYWFAEGLLGEHQNLEEVRNRGISIVECLKYSCLLEEGHKKATVKMHDVVRDVAVWIASTLEDECKSVANSGLGLRKITEEIILKSARRLSFMSNSIFRLPKSVNQCPLVSTLLLQGNRSIKHIPDGFLEAFPSLRVLDLSDCHIESLPLSLGQLVELRALILARCTYLQELPPVEGLGKLHVLDCSSTKIKRLPEGMERLTNLRQLDLSCISSSTTIPFGAMAGLSNLEILDMSRNTGQWFLKGIEGEVPTPLEDILLLERLRVWDIDLESIPVFLTPSDALTNRIKNLERFRVHIGVCSRSVDMFRGESKRRVILNDHHFSGEWIGWLFLNATSIHLYCCEGLNMMFERIVMSSGGVGSFDSLKVLDIAVSQGSFYLRGSCNMQFDLLPNLEILYLRDLTRLTCISQLAEHLGLKFSRLKRISIERCPQLKYLLRMGASIPQLGQLEEINLDSCVGLEEIFRCDSNSSSHNFVPDAVFPNVRIMRLINLPKLQSFCRRNVTWPRVEKLEVIDCHLLRRLPLTIQNASTIRVIEGESQWWNQLEWEDDEIQSSLENFFKPVRFRN